jgi:hypothetical protein
VSDQTHARLQRIEEHVRKLEQTVSVLSAVDGDAAKARIAETFGSDARMSLIYRGVQRGLTQQKIADELRARSLKGAQQARVSNSFAQLEDLGFIHRTPESVWVVTEGWKAFGIEKVLRKTLRDAGVDDLG